MLVQHNPAAMNAFRNMAKNRSELSKNLEKLSSGYAINRSGDDAAGLAISEKMRWQVTGMTRAIDNVKEGEGLIQTGEAALAEVHDMLGRLASLAEQSANGTYDDDTDRAQLQKELESIREEIGRVADSTNFNNIKLFQDEGLEMERDVTPHAMRTDNIPVDFTRATHTRQTFDLSGAYGAGIADGETFTLHATLSDGQILSCELTAHVNAATGETRFVNGSGMIVGTQASTVFGSVTKGILSDAYAGALNESAAGESMSFASDGAGKITGTAKNAGSSAPIIVSSGLMRGSVGGGGASVSMSRSTVIGGDQLPAIKNSSITPYNGSNAKEAVFTVNGKKFAVGLASTDISKLGADVVYIPTKTDTSRASARDTGIATAEQQADLRNIAGELSRVTGLDVLYRPEDTTLGSSGSVNNVFVFRDRQDASAGNSVSAIFYGTRESESIPLEQVLADDSPALKNIIYEDVRYSFETTPTPGAANSLSAEQAEAAKILKEQIIPQTVEAIMTKYPAFNYLSGSSIGIGLYFDSDLSGKTTLAYVKSSTNRTNMQSYQLGINPSTITNLSNDASRTALEQTIAHEMIHAFMFEATTKGMFSGDGSDQYPDWFIEGMAQTASGPGNWTKDGNLGLTVDSTAAVIQSKLSYSDNKLGSNTSTSQYGTGYLACMYLGYLANGGSVDMNNPTVAAAGISTGLSNIMSRLIQGSESLETVIGSVSGGKYTTISAFESGFASDTGAQTFISSLLQYTSGTVDGKNVAGGLLSGSLAAADPVSNTALAGIKLFELDTTTQTVSNVYPADVTVNSGSGKTTTGAAPVGGITDPTPVTPVTYDANPFTISEGSEGTDWKWDVDTGTLEILKAGTYSIGKNSGFSGDYTGVIKVADGAGVTMNLNGVTIDAAKQSGNLAGIDCGSGSAQVNINTSGNTTIKGSGAAAGIQVGKGTAVSVLGSGSGSLSVTGGSSGGAGIGTAYGADASGAKIDVRGKVTAQGGTGGAGIGAGMSSSGLSQINVVGRGNDTTIRATGGNGAAGIGGGRLGDNSSCEINLSNEEGGVLNLTAVGGTQGAGVGGGQGGKFGAINVNANGTITATGGIQAAGIGNGYQGTLTGDIKVGSGKITATGGEHGAGIGGSHRDNRTGGIQNIVISGGDITARSTYHGTGIGAGCSGIMKDITITGGTIRASGGDGGAAIGAGANGGGSNSAGVGSRAGNITISGGIVNAVGGENGSGIGSGQTGSEIGNITISGGIVNAKGSTDSTGIGSGHGGTITGGITISGGTITAKGGMTNDGGNIGGYSDSSQTTPTTVTITDPNNLSIKAGDRGEGIYNTTGVKDSSGNELYAFKLDKSNLKLESAIKFPIKVTATNNGRTYTWELSADGSRNGEPKHQTGANTADEAIYIWMEGHDAEITITDADGNNVVAPGTKLFFYDDAKVWRLDDSTNVSEFTQKPSYSNDRPDGADEEGIAGIQGELRHYSGGGGIILQVGTRYEDRLEVPRFYFSRRALKLDDMDISTQSAAQKTMGIVKDAINRVSDMRGEYGALQNALGHITNNLSVTRENVSAAESLIRDTDVAEEMSGFVRNQILNQSAQAMLAQANGLSQQAVELMRT